MAGVTMFCILVVLMSHDGETESYVHFFNIANYMILVLYVLEATAKCYGLGPRAYFKVPTFGTPTTNFQIRSVGIGLISL